LLPKKETMTKSTVLAAAAVLALTATNGLAQQMGPAARAVLGACKPDIAHF